MITLLTSFVLADRVQIASINQVDCFWRTDPRTSSTVFLLEEFVPLESGRRRQPRPSRPSPDLTLSASIPTPPSAPSPPLALCRSQRRTHRYRHILSLTCNDSRRCATDCPEISGRRRARLSICIARRGDRRRRRRCVRWLMW